MSTDDEILDTLKKILASQEASLAMQQAAQRKPGTLRTVIGCVIFLSLIAVIAYVAYTIHTLPPPR